MNQTATTTRPDLLDELTNGMRASLKLSQDMLETLSEENRALRGMDTPLLFGITKRKDLLYTRMQAVDAALKDVIGQVESSLAGGCPPHGRLDTLLPLLPEEPRAVLSQYREKVRFLREEIVAKNLINRRFTQDTLTCINDAIALFSAPPAPEKALYSTRGRYQKTSCQPAMISREI